VELIKIVPLPDYNKVLVQSEEGAFVIKLDLNSAQMWIECLIGTDECVHDIGLIPQSANFDPIIVVLTTANL